MLLVAGCRFLLVVAGCWLQVPADYMLLLVASCCWLPVAAAVCSTRRLQRALVAAAAEPAEAFINLKIKIRTKL